MIQDWVRLLSLGLTAAPPKAPQNLIRHLAADVTRSRHALDRMAPLSRSRHARDPEARALSG